MKIDWPLAILQGAGRLVPASLRAEWLAEWRAELWYVQRSGAPVARFCAGAFPDAFCLWRNANRATLHLESPAQCMLVLAVLASASLFLAFYWPVHREVFFPPADDAESRLVLVATHLRPPKLTPTITFAQYQAWSERMPAPFTALAFYQRLPKHFGAGLLAEPAQMPPLPAGSLGFVIARMRTSPSSFGHVSLPAEDGVVRGFDYRALAPRLQRPFTALAMMTVIAWLVLRVTPWSSPARRQVRLWMFLAAKLLLVLPIVFFGALDVAYLTGSRVEGFLLLAGWFVAVRWILRDQRRRCPVCLRLLINPVGIGQASQTFLGWYGTELMCAKGHGMLHVAEIPTSSSSASRWVQLDPSWSGLF